MFLQSCNLASVAPIASLAPFAPFDPLIHFLNHGSCPTCACSKQVCKNTNLHHPPAPTLPPSLPLPFLLLVFRLTFLFHSGDTKLQNVLYSPPFPCQARVSSLRQLPVLWLFCFFPWFCFVCFEICSVCSRHELAVLVEPAFVFGPMRFYCCAAASLANGNGFL